MSDTKNSAQGRKMAPMPRKVCAHCGIDYPSNNYTRHERVCLENPVLVSKLFATLHEMSTDGYGPTQEVYVSTSNSKGLPSIKKLVDTYGSYDGAIEAAGLLTFSATLFDAAVAIADVQSLSDTLYADENVGRTEKIGPSPKDWANWGNSYALPTIGHHFGSWSGFLTAAGLLRMPQQFYARRYKIQRKAWNEIVDSPRIPVSLPIDAVQIAYFDRGIREIYCPIAHQTITAHIYELR